MTGFWMAAALSKDLPAGVVMPVQTPDGAVALWRSRSGRVSACDDRCPHRGMRLSHGFVRGEALSCIYHGWSYAGSGACTRIPAHPDLQPPAAIRVPVRPVAEAGGLVWIAVGAPEGAPPGVGETEPLRSLTVEAGHAAIAAATAGAAAPTAGELAAQFLLTPEIDGRTVVHVMVAQGSGPAARIAASRWAEAVRRGAETGTGDKGRA